MPQAQNTRLNISRPLLKWYDQHRRVLPWRALPNETPDPYRVWLAEIMLQQTTVATVGPYYLKFLKKWPTVSHLAKASRDDVLAAWAGLGYYSRARNLHTCAQTIYNDYNGVFPDTEAGLLALPGVGPYTAAAVAAIAFNRPANVVDGNVERVMSRLFRIQTPLPAAKPEIKKLAAPLVPEKRPGDYAQALMDLGATICTPRNPKCGQCPLEALCAARAAGDMASYPRKVAKTARPQRQARIFALIDHEGRYLFRTRPEKGLLAGMLELPSSPWQEKEMELSHALTSLHPLSLPTKWQELPETVRHVFTHFELTLRVHTASAGKKAIQGQWLRPEEAENAALPSLMRKVLRLIGRSR